MHRVTVFIDGGYLDHIILDEFQGQKVDYYSLSKSVVDQTGADKEIIRIYYYHCLPYQGSSPTPEESQRFGRMQSFFRGLQRTPRFEVRQGRLAFRGMDAQGQPIFEQKRIDLLLGIDLVLLAAKRLIAQAFIIAGDSDLIPAISAAKSEAITVYLVHGSACSDDLLDEADERIRITPALISSALRML